MFRKTNLSYSVILTYVSISGVRIVSFLEIFAYEVDGCSLMRLALGELKKI